jgi:hypothetical protein
MSHSLHQLPDRAYFNAIGEQHLTSWNFSTVGESLNYISWRAIWRNTIRCMKFSHVRFEAFTAVTMKKAVFWDLAPCRCGINRFVPPQRRLTPHIHGAKSQKTAFFIVTAVKASNLTWISLLFATFCTQFYRNSLLTISPADASDWSAFPECFMFFRKHLKWLK